MKSDFVLTDSKLNRYLDENEGWKKTIHVQADEIPGMKEMLGKAVSELIQADEEMEVEKKYFESRLTDQQKEMGLLETALEEQQKRLSNQSDRGIVYDISSFCTQDILRDKIKSIEKAYIELKCNLMYYLSALG